MKIKKLNESGYKLTIKKNGKTFNDYCHDYRKESAVAQMKAKYGDDIEVLDVVEHNKINEGIDVATIADYITDHYKFETIDDKYSCINSIRDSFKGQKTISKEELEQFIGAHNGKDKMEESIDGWDNRTGVIKRIDRYLYDNPEAIPPKGYIQPGSRAYDDAVSRYGDYVTTPFGNIRTDELMQYARDNKLLDESTQPLYIIKDKNGNQLSAPNPDDGELWDKVASMEARGRTGLSVVAYVDKTNKSEGPYIKLSDPQAYIDELGFAGAVEIKGDKVYADEETLRQLAGAITAEYGWSVNINEAFNVDTVQKRIARHNEFDNGHVIHNYEKMTSAEAEEKARLASIEKPNDIYYVSYDDIMNPSSDIKWKNGQKINEASYGGAFDIEDDQIFTREDIDNLAEEVLNHINETYDYKFDISAAYIDGNELEVGVENDELGEYITKLKIDMRKVKQPWHLKRVYASEVASDLINQISTSLNNLGESLTESATEDAKPIETGAAVGMATVLSDLIKDEYEAIDGYNAAIATAETEGFGDMVKVLTDIQAEENIHIGQLQELMKIVDPNASKVEDGTAEAEEILSNPSVNDDDFDFEGIDESFDVSEDDIADEDVDAAIKAVEEAMKEPNKQEIDLTSVNFDLDDDDEVIVESTEPWEDIYNSFKDIEVQLNGDGEAITATIDRIYNDNKGNPDFEKAYKKWAANE